MRILVEGYPYEEKVVEDVLPEAALRNTDKKVVFDYVGYCFNPALDGGKGDCVFFLPKVVLSPEGTGADKQDLVFGKRPEEIVRLDADCPLDDPSRRFLHELAAWIYRGLVVFRNRNKNSDVLKERTLPRKGLARKRRLLTLLDVMLALRDFAKENRDFVLFQVKNLHRGMNRVDWRRTVATTQAVVADGTPVYLSPVNRKREIDLDEELLVIFQSILAHLRDRYGFETHTDFSFERIPKAKFEAWLKGYGRRRLLQIKYRYFSDRTLELWDLCYAFFDHTGSHAAAGAGREYLLAKDFQVVFEAIIDELLGDQNLPDAARKLKEQRDGKLVDHLWLDDSLIQGRFDQVYHIGDSKYYKIGESVGTESRYKQFTYARNVVQWNLGLFHGTKAERAKRAGAGAYGAFKLRDDDTEGYDIIPNFFISADLDRSDPTHAKPGIEPIGNPEISRQFENRLFDRDTLIVSRYNVNFLYVLSLYARNSAAAKRQWRETAVGQFRVRIRTLLDGLFEFSAMRPRPGTDPVRFLRENFRYVLGKVFAPWKTGDTVPFYSLALDRSPEFDAENKILRKELERGFEIVPCPLGEDPAALFPSTVAAPVTAIPAGVHVPLYWLERYPEDYILVGCCPDKKHFDWYFRRHEWKQIDLYNVRLGNRPGAVSVLAQNALAKAPKFLVLYEDANAPVSKAFRIVGHRIVSRKELEASGYPKDPGKTSFNYLCYELEEEISFGSLDIPRLLTERQAENPSTYMRGMPLFLKGSELIGYRTSSPA
ncbi:MAG: LlaJI family restriction endonuclease [Kiritimatiellae bacterium]|nr:LlaJI family restriction endonuclease [Kiritimatiellia bacterium]